MQYYVAPLEGITDSIYRRLHHKYFPGADRYYTPFFSPTVHRSLTPRESRELPPADVLPVTVVPQVLTKVSQDFIWMAGMCKELGYEEINLNLGCPSGTVTAKGKGAGMLRQMDVLQGFLDEIFTGSSLPISIKTRIGFEQPEEFYQLLDLFNRYPIAELTVHPRVRQDFYSAPVRMEYFNYADKNAQMKLCFNGNLCSVKQVENFSHQYSQISAVMLGRGLIADPGMLTPGGTTVEKLEEFLSELLEEYTISFGGSRNAMFRLKENWRYLFCLFESDEKLKKQLRKTTDIHEYQAITKQILHNLPLRQQLQPDW